MKRLFYCITLALLLTACYTTEENYKAAYDKAKERTRENMGGTIYDMSQAERVRATEIINGDSVRLLRSYFNVVDDKYENTKKFGVVWQSLTNSSTPAATATASSKTRASRVMWCTPTAKRNIAWWHRPTTRKNPPPCLSATSSST